MGEGGEISEHADGDGSSQPAGNMRSWAHADGPWLGVRRRRRRFSVARVCCRQCVLGARVCSCGHCDCPPVVHRCAVDARTHARTQRRAPAERQTEIRTSRRTRRTHTALALTAHALHTPPRSGRQSHGHTTHTHTHSIRSHSATQLYLPTLVSSHTHTLSTEH